MQLREKKEKILLKFYKKKYEIYFSMMNNFKIFCMLSYYNNG